MSYTIEYLEDKQAYIVTLNEDFDTEVEIQEYYDDMMERLNAETSMVTIIMDVTPLPTTLDTLMNGTKSALGASNNPNNHENVQQVILVTNNTLVKFSIDGFLKFGIAKNMSAATSVQAAIEMLS